MWQQPVHLSQPPFPLYLSLAPFLSGPVPCVISVQRNWIRLLLPAALQHCHFRCCQTHTHTCTCTHTNAALHATLSKSFGSGFCVINWRFKFARNSAQFDSSVIPIWLLFLLKNSLCFCCTSATHTHTQTLLQAYTHRWRAKTHIHFRNFIALHLIFNALTMCKHVRVYEYALCVCVCALCVVWLCF